ncbi:hypothetical protein Sjap_017273 [Stephania japonica]|uniref:Remorin C-terminal domain-containing protein n=1 Tax=Stephania japonica TaxID=461633 RepID=A0AAP0I5V8_9MAGN
MAELGFREPKKSLRLAFRDDSPDSVIATHDPNFSLFSSSASGSVDRCSFASDVHDHDSLVSELSKCLGGRGGLNDECCCGPNLGGTDYSISAVKHGHITIDRETTSTSKEEGSLIVELGKSSFSRALTECQARRIRSGAQLRGKKSGSSSSPRLGMMKKTPVCSNQSGTFPSPSTPNYRQVNVGVVQKGWSSERVPLQGSSGKRNVGVAQLPFNNGRALPSKWEDAEKWIFSPVSGDSGSRASAPQPQRRPKAKSGPLGPPGVAYHLMHSASIPMFQDGSVGGFLAGSPFSPGVMATDGLIRRGNCNGDGASNTDVSYPALSDPCIMRSVSVHGWSSGHLSRSLPCGRDENLDGRIDAATMVSRDASRRDMATQMSPEGSAQSSPRRRHSFIASPPSVLPIVELKSHCPPKMEVRDVQVDGQFHSSSSWSKRYGVRWAENGFGSVGEWKKKSVENEAAAWEVSDGTKNISREEAKITAWENLQKAKAEAAVRKLEMKLEKKRSSSMDRIMKKLRSAQRKAQEMRTSISANQSQQIVRASNRTLNFRKANQMGSLSGCFTCHAF